MTYKDKNDRMLQQIVKEEVKQALGDILTPMLLKDFPSASLPLADTNVIPVSPGTPVDPNSYKVQAVDVADYVRDEITADLPIRDLPAMPAPFTDQQVILGKKEAGDNQLYKADLDALLSDSELSIRLIGRQLSDTPLPPYERSEIHFNSLVLNPFGEYDSVTNSFIPLGEAGEEPVYDISLTLQLRLYTYTPGDHLFFLIAPRNDPDTSQAISVATFPTISYGGSQTYHMRLMPRLTPGVSYFVALISQASHGVITEYGPYASSYIITRLTRDELE